MNASARDGASPLHGQHAVVTGGGRGIGKAIAFELARLGADVTLMGRDTAALQACAKELTEAHGVRVAEEAIELDSPDSIARAFAGSANRFGPVAILVNNAGIAHAAPFARTSLAKWNEVLAIDLTAPFLCIQQVLAPMVEAGSGRIVNIASTSGMTGCAYVTAYCAAKHGLVGLTRSLAIETARSGVTVNAVCPGFTDTDIVTRSVENIVAKTGRTPVLALADLVADNPQRRLIQPDEVGAAVGWLCLPAARSVTGQSLLIAGGELM